MLKLGSLFDGIGGFPLAGSRFGIKPVWASEIEPWPIKVTEKHFPSMKHLGDITQIDGGEIEPVDIITFGSPCQDLSVAGKREGLEGARSGLFYESIRVIGEMQVATDREYPKALVFENVPGLLSSHKGEDFKIVLDELQGLGFTFDPNILDAQFMGVPQRRRRVFISCLSIEHLLRQRTLLSWSIMTKCLTEILLLVLGELFIQLNTEPDILGLTKQQVVGGLRKRMKLFGIEDQKQWQRLLKNWEEMCRLFTKGQEDCNAVRDNSWGNTEWSQDTLFAEEEVNASCCTEQLWKTIWDAISNREKLFTTLTQMSEITNLITCVFALLVNILTHIIHCELSCKTLSETGRLYITMIERSTNLDARQANKQGLAKLEWLHVLRYNIERLRPYAEQLERFVRNECRPEIFPFKKGLRGDSAESRKTREEAAATVGDGVTESIGFDNQTGQSEVIEVSPAVRSESHGSLPCVATRINSTPEGISGAVSSKWAKGTGGPAGDECYNLVVLADQGGSQMNVLNDLSPTLRAQEHGHQPCVLYDMTHADEVMRPVKEGLAPTLNSRMGTGGNQVPVMLDTTDRHAVAHEPYQKVVGALCADDHKGMQAQVGMQYKYIVSPSCAVRRLTPLECLRLQGFPDDWLDIDGMSDTQKYKAVGNSVAIPCVEFVMAGIVRVIGGVL